MRIVRASRARRERNERTHHLTNVAARADLADPAEIRFTKEWRAVATRYEKLAVNYLATVQLALLRDFLRLLDSSDRA